MKVEIYVDSMLVATWGDTDLAIQVAKAAWKHRACDIEVWEWPEKPVPGTGHEGRGRCRVWKRFKDGTEVTA